MLFWLKNKSNFYIVFKVKKKEVMTWYMNFCSPFIPNDSTINFHRLFQGILLTLYSVAYVAVHVYYLYWGPLPLEHQAEEPRTSEEKDKKALDSDNSSNLQDNKSVSIKLEEHANESCVQLKKTSMSTWNRSDSSSQQKSPVIVENVTIQEVQQYCPIVYGHFAIAMALSIMYTPYAEQSIASILYALLTIPLLIANSKRMGKTTRLFWTLMGFILVFFFTCGLLEVGQSNWDVLNSDCFSNQYVSIYG